MFFVISVASPSSTQRQARVIHTSKKKVVVETKGGRSGGTKTKTIVTSSVVNNDQPEVVDTSGARRSSRAKQTANKKTELMPSPVRSLTNGTQRTTKSQALAAAANADSKYQRSLLAELSKKSSNYSPDVVSDLEEILGSPIKSHESRSEPMSRSQHTKNAQAKSAEVLRATYKSQADDDAKPATRSSKRLSQRIQPNIETVVKPLKSSSRKKTESTSFGVGLSSEESQEIPEESYNNLQATNNAPGNIVLNIKQEKEVSYIMTDENNVFTCEMCSAVFSDRAELLLHVPVHI